MDRSPASLKTFERCPECDYKLPSHSFNCRTGKLVGRRDFLKKLGLIAGLAGAGLSAGIPIGRALPGGTSSVVTPGSMVAGFDYIINKPASQAFARNGRTGDNDVITGTDEAVVQGTITNQPGGEEIFIMDNLALSSASIAIPANYTLGLIADGVASITAPVGKPIFTFGSGSVLILHNIRLVDSAIGLNDLIYVSSLTSYPGSAANLAAYQMSLVQTSPNLGLGLSIAGTSKMSFGIEVIHNMIGQQGIAVYNQGKAAVGYYGEISGNNPSIGGDTVDIVHLEGHGPSAPTTRGLAVLDFTGGITGVYVTGQGGASGANPGVGFQASNQRTGAGGGFTGLLVTDSQTASAVGNNAMADLRPNQDDVHIIRGRDNLRSANDVIKISKNANGGYYAALHNVNGERARLSPGTSGNRGYLKLYDATLAAFRYLTIDNGAVVISSTEPT